jgi:hypothetical protein
MWWTSTGVLVIGAAIVLGIARAVRAEWRKQREEGQRQALLARLATAMRAVETSKRTRQH